MNDQTRLYTQLEDPVETRRKLEALELLDALDILPRNLGIFFAVPYRLQNR
jgi:hypothetical protein